MPFINHLYQILVFLQRKRNETPKTLLLLLVIFLDLLLVDQRFSFVNFLLICWSMPSYVIWCFLVYSFNKNHAKIATCATIPPQKSTSVLSLVIFPNKSFHRFVVCISIASCQVYEALSLRISLVLCCASRKKAMLCHVWPEIWWRAIIYLSIERFPSNIVPVQSSYTAIE